EIAADLATLGISQGQLDLWHRLEAEVQALGAAPTPPAPTGRPGDGEAPENKRPGRPGRADPREGEVKSRRRPRPHPCAGGAICPGRPGASSSSPGTASRAD